MRLTSPLFRARGAARSMGATSEQADRFADAMRVFPTPREAAQQAEATFNRYLLRSPLRSVLAMIIVAESAIATLRSQ